MINQTDGSEIQILSLPREPFLPHSERLFHYLCHWLPDDWQDVLEIGCGPNSPLPSWLLERQPNLRLQQLDAQAQVVSLARLHTPHAKVSQALASDLNCIADASVDLIVAMSVFDQNPASSLPAIGAEICRVLRDGGAFLYIHNEEMNLPASAASALDFSQGRQLLLPSDTWLPTNDQEYCLADRSALESAISAAPESFGPLIAYLRGIYPRLYGRDAVSDEVGKVNVPFLRQLSPQFMSQIRQCVRTLRIANQVCVVDRSLAEMIGNHVETQLLCATGAMQVQRSGVFGILHLDPWSRYLPARPAHRFFVRGLGRSGLATLSPPAPLATSDRTLMDSVSQEAIGVDQVAFLAYQYGVVALKKPSKS